MSSCLNTNAIEFRTIEKLSGLSSKYLAYFCSKFLEEHDRWPNLDEIPGADSSKYVKDILQEKDGYVSKDKVLEMTNSASLEEAQIKLNNTFSDLEIMLLPYTESVKLVINNKPGNSIILDTNIDHNLNISNFQLFGSIITKLQQLYGINVHNVDLDFVQENLPGHETAKAFVYNGEIYINTDLADKDAPIHEMMHILLGSLRNTPIYYELVNSIANSEIIEYYKSELPNRTLNDVAEEAFIEEFARLVSGIDSSLLNLSELMKYELLYHAKRILDTIIMGETSIKNFNKINVFNNSLIDLCKLVNSKLIVSKHLIDTSKHHRELLNIKRELLENNDLQEYCQ